MENLNFKDSETENSEEPHKNDGVIDKLGRNRARNKEHAKQTRLRKKNMIEGLKNKIIELQQEVIRIFLNNTFFFSIDMFINSSSFISLLCFLVN